MSRIRSKASRRAWLIGAATVLALGTAGAGVVSFELASHPAAQAAQVDMRGNQVRLEPGVAPSAVVVARMKVTLSTGQRFAVPSVGLDVPLGALTAVDNSITPPGFTSAYLIRNFGTTTSAPAAGTVYVVTHSIRGGGVAPGNYLADIHTQQSRVKPGATLDVAGVLYRVTASETVAKTALPTDGTVWANLPNRLVVITCLEKADGTPSTDNLVLFATRIA
jgi:hypothetical protein